MWEAGDLACPPSLMTGSFCNGRSISFDRGPDARRRPTALALFAKVGSLSRPSYDHRKFCCRSGFLRTWVILGFWLEASLATALAAAVCRANREDELLFRAGNIMRMAVSMAKIALGFLLTTRTSC
jgi:hypothetical protein